MRVLLLSAALFTAFLSSCASTRTLRTVQDVEDFTRGGLLRDVPVLLEASRHENRDVQAAAIDALSLSAEELLDEAVSLSRVPDKETPQAAARRLSALRKSERELADVRAELERRLELSGDFNVRNLCLDGLSIFRDATQYRILLKASLDGEAATACVALRNLRPFLTNGSFEVEPAVEASLQVLGASTLPVTSFAVSNLFLLPARPQVAKALDQSARLARDPFSRRFLEDAAKRYAARSKQP